MRGEGMMGGGEMKKDKKKEKNRRERKGKKNALDAEERERSLKQRAQTKLDGVEGN